MYKKVAAYVVEFTRKWYWSSTHSKYNQKKEVTVKQQGTEVYSHWENDADVPAEDVPAAVITHSG